MKTITLKDETAADLLAALGVASTPPAVEPPVVEPPAATPAGVKVVTIAPFKTNVGTWSARIPVGGSIAFKFTIPQGYSSGGKFCRFTISPTGGSDYHPHDMVLSDKPGDFVGIAVDANGTPVSGVAGGSTEGNGGLFTVGGYYMRGIFVKRPDKTKPDLAAGTYYYNVREKDQTLSSSVNYTLQVP